MKSGLYSNDILHDLRNLDLPSLATNRLDRQSGTLVPAASRVRPITVSGISRASP